MEYKEIKNKNLLAQLSTNGLIQISTKSKSND